MVREIIKIQMTAKFKSKYPYNNPSEDFEEPMKRIDNMDLKILVLEKTCQRIF